MEEGVLPEKKRRGPSTWPGIVWVLLVPVFPAVTYFVVLFCCTRLLELKKSTAIGISATVAAMSIQVPIIWYFLVSIKAEEKKKKD